MLSPTNPEYAGSVLPYPNSPMNLVISPAFYGLSLDLTQAWGNLGLVEGMLWMVNFEQWTNLSQRARRLRNFPYW
jgi:hypothetical protein